MSQTQTEDSLWPGLSGLDSRGPYLNASKCGHCGTVMLGQRTRCSRCWADDKIEAVAVGRRGRVYSRTVIHAAPAGYVGPYTVGYVDLPEGIRVFAHLQAGPDTPAIGDEVQLDIVSLRTTDGQALTGPRYRRLG
jgi:uncharacterized OB-fold protein